MKSGEHFDVIIIGAGPSGIFCAYELIKEKPELNILMIEKGRPIEKRVCPKRKTKVCVGCKPCSITTGFAGAGAFSDGKLSLSPDVGGNLPEILGYDKATELIRESDDIYLQFGADQNVYGVDKQQEKLKTDRMPDPPPRNRGRLQVLYPPAGSPPRKRHPHGIQHDGKRYHHRRRSCKGCHYR